MEYHNIFSKAISTLKCTWQTFFFLNYLVRHNFRTKQIETGKKREIYYELGDQA